MSGKVAVVAGGFWAAGCMVALTAGVSPVAGRVAADFSGNAPFVHYAVPAMSEQQRLPDAYPTDGVPNGTVNVVVARDEYEDGAFLVWPRQDLGKVKFEIGDLKQVKKTGEGEERETGVVFPKEDLDLRVVKVWYQNRNAWFSYFGDTELKLVPELLLHDEDLVRVDTKKVANYARLVDAKGKKSEVWLNPPREMSRRECEAPWITAERFEPMRGDFGDAKTLQPVTLQKEAFKQFYLTVHAKKSTKPGLYRGEVEVEDGGGQRIGSIPVAVRVLDFELPQPKCWGNPEKDFLVSFYDCTSIKSLMRLNGGDVAKAKSDLVNVFRNQVAHNHTVHWIGSNMSNDAFFLFDAMKEAGMRTDIHFSVFGPIHGDKEAATRPQRIADELDRRIGNHNSYIGYGDEPSAKWLENARPVYKAFQEAGLKFIIAGSDHVFNMAGYLYDWHNVAKDPSDSSSPVLWNGLQNDNHVAWYANHHVGSENPAFNRRQNGLTAYLSGYTALCNYENAIGPWNDLSTTYRPMVMAYAAGDGLIDTLQWEGFREGVDDIRYATLLSDLARKAQKAKELETRYLGGQAMQYLASLKTRSHDQDTARAEMIVRIEKLLKLVQPSVFRTSVVNDAAAAKAGAARGEQNLQRDLAAAKAKMMDAKNLNETNGVHRAVAAAYKRYFRFSEAGDYLTQAGLPEDAVANERTTGGCFDLMPEKLEAARFAVLKAHDDKGAQFGRGEAFWSLLPKQPELMKSHFDNVFLAGLKPTDTNGWRRVTGDVLVQLGRGRRYMAGQEFAASAAVYEKIRPLVEKWGVTVPALTARNLFEAYAHLGNDKEAAAVAKAGLKDEKAKPEEKAFLTLASAFAGYRGDEKGARALAQKTAAALDGVSNADRVKAIQLLGSVLYGARREGAVRGLEAYRLSLYKPEPKKRYVVKFSDAPITGISDMERVEAESAVYDRAYGGDMEFLTTDVTSGNRGDVGSSKDKLPPPSMKVVADAQGIHILVTAKDPKAKEIELGLVGDYSFESYIAPGANTPYYCMITELRARKMSIFNASYNTADFRRLEKDDFGRLVKFDRVYREGVVCCYFFYSWENWTTRLPKNGSVWDYENMCWHRAGNSCWNGTASIHGRSTWGEFEFALTDAQRVAIVKPLLAKTYDAYKAEKHMGGQTALGHWKDAVLGDPAFYAARVAPLEKELDRFGGLLTSDMIDTTVFWLEREALPRWYDIGFEVSRRRAQWLTDGSQGERR